MVISLVIYILSNILGLAFQQFAFMQIVREIPPYKRIERVAHLAFLFFSLTLASGLYYYTYFYDIFERVKVLSGDHPWVHQVFVETKGISLVLIPILSLLFIRFIKIAKKNNDKKSKSIAAIAALSVLAFATLNIGTEILIGGAAN